MIPTPPSPHTKRQHRMCVKPWVQQRDDKGAYTDLLSEFYRTDTQAFTNYTRMTPESFQLIKDRIEHASLYRMKTNYRALPSVGMKLARILNHLGTGESYTCLSYQFMVSRSTISKFVPKVCKAIQEEFMAEYLSCPTTPEEWKVLEAELRSRWNVSNAIGVLEGKQIVIKKLHNSGNIYYNSKSIFSIVMFALVDAEYKFRWVDVGTCGSCSDAQIFNSSVLKRKVEDGSIVLLDPAPIPHGGPHISYYILGDDAFA